MDLTVITGWSPDGYHLYGRNFMEGFTRHWPADVRLVTYVEKREGLKRAEEILIQDLPEVTDFLARHRGNMEAKGIEPNDRWGPKSLQHGYDYRFDAYRFGRVPLYIRHAAHEVGEGRMIWLDGDVMTFAPVTEDLIDRVLPEGVAVSYLGRVAKHSEIGFQGYRLPDALPFIDEFADWYATDSFLRLHEWHTAYCFDRTADGFPGLCRTLTPEGKKHVWFQSPLGEAMDHLKGERRKKLGRSPERPENAA